MLVELSAAALQGAPVVTQDVDLWFKGLNDPRLREALQETGVAYVAPSPFNPPMFVGKGVELFDIVLTKDGLEGFDQKQTRGSPAHLSGGRSGCTNRSASARNS